VHGYPEYFGRAVISDPMRDVEWDVIPSSPHPPHMHMALDEVLLDRVAAGSRRPTLLSPRASWDLS